MKRNVLLTIVTLVLFLAFLTGCITTGTQSTSNQDPNQQTTISPQAGGAAILGVIGAAAGALLDKNNRLRGAAIGGALGAIGGATIGDIMSKTAQQAAQTNREVVYRDDTKKQVFTATPVGYNPKTKCKIIHNVVIEDGKKIADNEQEVCT